MSITLPSAVQDFFSGKNARNLPLALSGFSPDPVVKDEHHEYIGRDAIAEWLNSSTAQYDDQVAVQGSEADGTDVVVLGEVSGTFPGSPIVLRFRFAMAEGKISELAIGS
jgi:SnoaL-like domain